MYKSVNILRFSICMILVSVMLVSLTSCSVVVDSLKESEDNFEEYSRFTEEFDYRAPRAQFFYLIDPEAKEIIHFTESNPRGGKRHKSSVSSYFYSGDLETGLHLIIKETGEATESFFMRDKDKSYYIRHYEKKGREKYWSPYHSTTGDGLKVYYRMLREIGYDGKLPAESSDTNSGEKDLGSSFIVVVDTGRIRQGPGTDTETICLVHRDDELRGTGDSEEIGETTWYEVYYNDSNDTGWVSEIVITPIEP